MRKRASIKSTHKKKGFITMRRGHLMFIGENRKDNKKQ